MTTAWALYNTFRDPALLAAVRAEVDACTVQPPTAENPHKLDLDMDALLRQPVLQAVYAETLRLRMHFYIIRMPDPHSTGSLHGEDGGRPDNDIAFPHGWTIPRTRQTHIITSTTVAHRDADAWDSASEKPLDEFWAGRFLRRRRPGSDNLTASESEAEAEEFTHDGHRDGAWIPYGGGPRICPGRHFAKRQVLLTVGLMVGMFDAEMVGDEVELKEDLSLGGFGNGISCPVGPVGVRLRRRVR